MFKPGDKIRIRRDTLRLNQWTFVLLKEFSINQVFTVNGLSTNSTITIEENFLVLTASDFELVDEPIEIDLKGIEELINSFNEL